ncbi:catalase [Paraburkholderia youngii]|uniref:catalase n=1 Tax=Paraburkholderia youngii TaxID=2782701 RepID=UPI003D215F12
MNGIDAGNFPKWRFAIREMSNADAASCRFNPFDITKVWSQEDHPMIRRAGRVQARECGAGIGFSPRPLLQLRLFSCGNTQRYRLGICRNQIPANTPRAPSAHSFHRDRAMRTHGNPGGIVDYQRNPFSDFARDANASERLGQIMSN